MDSMRFLKLHLFHKEDEFGDIVGYDDIKDLVRRALNSHENYNLLLCGPPASAKTLFLVGILECRKGVYFEGNNRHMHATNLRVHTLPRCHWFQRPCPCYYLQKQPTKLIIHS
jgi:hypothetical protein